MPKTRPTSSANGLRRDMRLRQPIAKLMRRRAISFQDDAGLSEGVSWADATDDVEDSLLTDDDLLAVVDGGGWFPMQKKKNRLMARGMGAGLSLLTTMSKSLWGPSQSSCSIEREEIRFLTLFIPKFR